MNIQIQRAEGGAFYEGKLNTSRVIWGDIQILTSTIHLSGPPPPPPIEKCVTETEMSPWLTQYSQANALSTFHNCRIEHIEVNQARRARRVPGWKSI